MVWPGFKKASEIKRFVWASLGQNVLGNTMSILGGLGREKETSSSSRVPCLLVWGISYVHMEQPTSLTLAKGLNPRACLREAYQEKQTAGHFCRGCRAVWLHSSMPHWEWQPAQTTASEVDCWAQVLLQLLSSVSCLTATLLLQITVLIPLPGFPLLSGRSRASYRPVNNPWPVEGWGMIWLLLSWGRSPWATPAGNPKGSCPLFPGSPTA